jgi:hypothetical protein
MEENDCLNMLTLKIWVSREKKRDRSDERRKRIETPGHDKRRDGEGDA